MKSDQELLSEDEFTEDSFLKGRISVVRSAIDRPVHARGKYIVNLITALKGPVLRVLNIDIC